MYSRFKTTFWNATKYAVAGAVAGLFISTEEVPFKKEDLFKKVECDIIKKYKNLVSNFCADENDAPCHNYMMMQAALFCRNIKDRISYEKFNWTINCMIAGGLLGAAVGAYYGYQEAILIEQRELENIRRNRP